MRRIFKGFYIKAKLHVTINLLCLFDGSFIKNLLQKSSGLAAVLVAHRPSVLLHHGSVALHGVYGRAAVFVPQVDGFGHDGVRVLLRYLGGGAA